ncbi:alpha/beta hydrolase [Virgibacillus siamensis]|uniref:Alpha/beta hydrolase n=1 Tax=Virgibacillus siamensis TaxID=480071 RepID=A0ABP3R6M8_9BACI
MKKQHIIIAAALFSFFIITFLMTDVRKSAESENKIKYPTVFVHGYKGTVNSFGNMLDRYEHKYGWGNKAIVYHVSSSGHLNVRNLSKGKNEPAFVQVIFENNRASIADTSKWLAKVLAHMKRVYRIDSVNLVGHSMGGLVSMKYVQAYQDTAEYPRVHKLVTIGSPFDGIYSKEYFQINRDPATVDLKPDSGALKLLQANKEAIPDSLQVLSIGSTGDIVALPESVHAIRKIVSEDQLTEKIIENKSLGHSGLHESATVDILVYSFLGS